MTRDTEQEVKPCKFVGGACVNCDATERGDCQGFVCNTHAPREWVGLEAEDRERLVQPDAYGYASRLAVAIWERHYRDAAPQWKPLDDLFGVLTQIDNMTSGLTRLAQPQMQPCAGRNCGSTKPNLHSAECFEDYEKATGMNQWRGLTVEEIIEVIHPLVMANMADEATDYEIARAIEAKLREKNA